MASFLEAIGRSGRVPALTQQINAIPGQELAMESGKTQLAIDKLKFAEMQRQQEASTHPISISLLSGQFKDKEAADLAKQIAADLGVIKVTPSGEEYMTIADISQVVKIMEQPGYVEKFSQIAINGAKNRIAQIQTAMQSVKKPEELQALQQQLDQAKLAYNVAVQNDVKLGEHMKEVQTLTASGKYTPETVAEFQRTGDRSVLLPIQEVEKSFTLGPGQTRYTPEGEPIVSVPAKKEGGAEDRKYSELTKDQQMDNARGFYSLKMKALLDPDGYVKEGNTPQGTSFAEEYMNLSNQMEEDLRRIDEGKKPGYLTRPPEAATEQETATHRKDPTTGLWWTFTEENGWQKDPGQE